MGETSKKERKIRNQIGTSFRAFPCAKIRTFSDMAKLFFGSRHDLFGIGIGGNRKNPVQSV